MRKNFKWLLALVAMVASINLMWAGEVVFYTNTCPEDTKAKVYDQEKTTTVDNIDWIGTVNRNAANDWRIGGKGKTALDRYLYTGTAISENITKVVLTHGQKSAGTVGKVKLDVFSTKALASAGGTGDISSISLDYVDNGTMTFTRPTGHNWTSRFYRFSYSVNPNNNSNKAVILKKIEFYYDNTPAEPVAPSFTVQPEDATYEQNKTATPLSIEVTGNPNPELQWYSNTTKSTSGATAIANATNASYTPSTATIGTKYYYCVATNTQGSATSDIVAVTVTAALPKITITASSISDFSGSYAARAWTAGGVSGQCYAYRAGSSPSYLMQFNETPYVYNTTEVPGKIKSIKIVKGGGSDRSWSVYCGTSALTSTEGGTQIGTSQTVSTSYTWTVPDNTEYTYFYITKGSNSTQISEFVITYEELAPTNEAVTFAAPEGGSLVIKNGATSIESGTTIQNGTVLDVEFGMTPAEAYKDVAIKVTNTTTSADVTSTVYNSETQKITMPRYPITVAVTFTKLYKISLVKAGEGTGSATMNGVTTDIYVDGETQIDLVASAVAPNEFTKWSATEKIAIDKEGDAETYAYASGDGTITATFGVSALLPLDAPTLSAPTNITYNSVTLNWQELANAEGGYHVEILLNDEPVVYESGIGETSWTPDFTFQANTTYTYTVQGIGDGSTYAEENNPKATSTFTTADYPAVTLTLSENGNTTPVNGKLNTPIELPTTSTQACDGKVFVGWSEDPIEGEVGKDQVSLLDATYTFTDPSVLEKTIYAVYAKKVEGDKYFEKVSSAPSDWCGKYLIVYETGNLAMDGSLATLDAVSNTKAVTISDSKIAWSAEMEAITFTVAYKTGSSTVYSLKSASGKYISGTTTSAAASNGLKQADTDVDYEISFNDLTIESKSSDQQMVLKYNKSSGQTRFRFYKSGQEDIAMYKYSATIDYSNYCTTCEAAIAVPTFSLDEGEYDEAKTLELTAPEGDIYYTINDGTETKYTAAIALNNRGTYEISAYAKVDDRESETVTKTYTLNWAYTLAELVAEGEPTTTGRTVTVILTNEIIESFATSGSYVNGFFTMVGDKKIEVYCQNSPATWEVGGKVSGTVTCPWKLYNSTWELCPANWDWASYTAPAKIESLVIDGDVNNKNYTAGQKLDFTGLTVTGVYSDNTEEDVTADVVWTEVTLTENQIEATATATLNDVRTGNKNVSENKTITGLTVGAAKTLESIYVDNEHSTHKTAFFVGRPFSAEGLKVMARYNMGDDQQIALANLTIDNPTFSAAEAEHTINISYTENDVTKETSYNVEVKYMNLNDLVAEDIPTNTSVKVSFSNVEITGFYKNKSEQRTGVYVNVKGKNDKNIELYYNTPSTDLDAWQEGGLLATKNAYISGTWSYYSNGEVWEITFASGWDWDTNLDYTAPNIPVTSMEISPAEVSVKEGTTTTLSIVYDPTNATNTDVTWAVTEGSDFASVDAETGVVTGLKAGTATITATLIADENITATCAVTVEELPIWATTYTSNVTVGTDKVKLAEAYQPADYPEDGYDAKKTGSSNTAGTINIKVPAGAYELHYHAAAWSSNSETLTIKNGTTTIAEHSILADAGLKNNTPFTLANNPVDEYYMIKFEPALTEETTLTFSASSNRFVLFGVNAIQPAEITLDEANEYDFGEVKENASANKTMIFTVNDFADVDNLAVSFTGEDADMFSADNITATENDKEYQVEVTFTPGKVQESIDATLKITDGEATASHALSGKAISATTPEIVVSDDEIDFGTVKQDATITPQTVTVTLNYLDAATASISENDAFTISPTSLVLGENTITISATASSMGAKNATITITGEGATTKTIAVTMDVISKYANEYTSNVEVGSDKVIIDEVEYEANKKGTSSASQSATIIVPKGTQTLHFHAAAWNNENTVLVVKQGETTLGSFNLYKDAGVKSNSPFTLAGNNYSTEQYFYVDVAAYTATDAAEITFTTTASPYRFVLYGVNQEGGAVPVLDRLAIGGSATKTEYEIGDTFDPIGLTVNAIYKLEGVDQEPVDVTEDVDWEFTPATLTEGSYDVTVKATYEGKEVSTTVAVVVAAPTPEITVNTNTVSFGIVAQNAEVTAKTVAVTLKAIANATVAVSGEGASAFNVTPEALTESGDIAITPITTTAGDFAATITISADGAESKTITLSISVGATPDVITASDLAATTTTYTEFSNVEKESGTVYAGMSAKSSAGAIQLRSSNSNSGIVSTSTIGFLKAISFTVESGSNTIQVYGKNSAYTNASDLYNKATQGTLLGKTTTTGGITLEDGINLGDYRYIGIRSASGAIYLTNVSIAWTPATFYNVTLTQPKNIAITANIDKAVAGETITLNATPEEGYAIDNWIGLPEGATISTDKNKVTFTMPAENVAISVTYTSLPRYTVSFSKGAASGSTPNAITNFAGTKITLPSKGNLSYEGYVFGGWNDGSTTYAAGSKFEIPDHNVQLNAQWIATVAERWIMITAVSQLNAGDSILIACKNKNVVSGDLIDTYLSKTDAVFSKDGKTINGINNPKVFKLGGSDGAWTFANANNTDALLGANVGQLAWGAGTTTWTIAFAESGLATITSTAEGNGILKYSSADSHFNVYTTGSGLSFVNLYKILPPVTVKENVDASTIEEYANVSVEKGGNLLMTEPKTLGDLSLTEEGKITIETEAKLTVNNFVIKSTMAGGKSSQVMNVTTENFVVEGEAYYDVVLGDNGNPEKWHAFAVPFNVDAINGVYDLDDNKLTNEVNYAIMDYHGDVRAQGQYGWKKFRGIMNPGVFYLMTVDGEHTTYRMKMNGGFSASSSTISVQQYAQSGAGTEFDAGWNGIANNQLGYSSVAANVQVLNPSSYTFETKTASEYNFTVGTPFFYQAGSDGTIVLDAANSDKPAYAPRMTAEAKNIAVTLGNDNYTDRLYISATDEATNEYQIGRDLVKMTMTNTPAVPQIFAEAYGTKLSMIDVPMMYDEAVYALNLYAPTNGEYTIGAAQVKGYEVFLTQYGSVIWNLSMSEATIELTKGNNTEYGLILKATSGHAPTDINTINGQESVQKFLYNSNIYIIRENQKYNAQGIKIQ